jgi:hypothetical protein
MEHMNASRLLHVFSILAAIIILFPGCARRHEKDASLNKTSLKDTAEIYELKADSPDLSHAPSISKETASVPELKAYSLGLAQAPDFMLRDVPPKTTPEPVPNVVIKAISNTVDRHCREYVDAKEIAKEECKRQSYGLIFEVKTPIKVDLYIARLHFSGWGSPYSLILYDKATDRATQNPPVISYPVIKQTMVEFRDLDGDGKPELKAEMSRFNGTAYNAEQERYYEIVDHLGMKLVLIVDATELLPKLPVMGKLDYVEL